MGRAEDKARVFNTGQIVGRGLHHQVRCNPTNLYIQKVRGAELRLCSGGLVIPSHDREGVVAWEQRLWRIFKGAAG